MEINFTPADVEKYSSLYEYDGDDILGKRVMDARMRGYLTEAELAAIARWKYPGKALQNRILENTEEEIREVTRASFSAITNRLRIGALLALRGVGWPMASVILHFAFPEEYPILDVRAMTTVRGSTNYTFERWMEYTNLCRKKAGELEVSLRDLDRALWVYDRVHQGH